jgi:hypothetical protein
MTEQTSFKDPGNITEAERAINNNKPKKATDILTRDDKRDIVKQVKSQSTGVMNPVEYEQMKVLARDFIESGSVPSSFANASQVLMALQAGKEMGMAPVESMQSLYIVNGLLNVWGKALPRLLRRHGFMVNYKDESQESSTAVVASTDGKEMYEETRTYSDSELSGYTKDNQARLKVGWRPGVNRKIKLRYGALSDLVKTYIPEVLGSVADITEVAQDYGPINANSQPADNKRKIKVALADVKEIKAKPVEQEQDDE